MGDQAHTNRPRGDSTGGMLTLVAGLANLEKAIGSNDAEVQSILEAEDQIFRVQLLWTELHGASGHRPLRQDLVETTEQQVLIVKGILCTDRQGVTTQLKLTKAFHLA